jgi:hypothetical protein
MKAGELQPRRFIALWVTQGREIAGAVGIAPQVPDEGQPGVDDRASHVAEGPGIVMKGQNQLEDDRARSIVVSRIGHATP